MSRFVVSPRSGKRSRCAAMTKGTDRDERGHPIDQCKLFALPGGQFCKRHASASESQ